MAHSVSLRESIRGQRSALRTVAQGVKKHIERKSMAVERDAEREQKDRIKALKENNMDAYLELVRKSKNERIEFLLSQTDKYLVSLSSLVSDQKQVTARFEEDVAERDRVAADKALKQRQRRIERGARALDGTAPSGDGDEDGSGMDDGNRGDIGASSDSDGGMGAGAGGGATSGAAVTGGDAADSAVPGSGDYYKSAHHNLEKLTEQPALLTGGLLKSYQLAGVEWMLSLYNNRLNGILADEMGLGKTVQTIALLAYLMEKKNNKGPFLVCVPLSTLSNWANEFTRWAPSFRVVVYKGTAPMRKDIWREQLSSRNFNVCLTTYDFTMRDKSKLSSVQWNYIIVDEGHRLKNAAAKFTMVLGHDYIARNRLLLTGTPLQNSLPELWSLLNFLLPKIFGSVDDFEAWFSKPFAAYSGKGGTGGDGDKAENLALNTEEKMLVIHRLHSVLRPFLLRRTKAEVLSQLPEKVERVLRCELSGWQRELYTQVQRYGCVAVPPGSRGASATPAGSTSGARGLSNLIIQLRKVCNHPYLFTDDTEPLSGTNDEIWRCSGKFELLDRMLPKLKRGGHRVLLFSQMTTLLNIMEDFLTYRGYSFLRLDGSTSAADREERMMQFNARDSPYFVFLLSTRAGGLGINLVSADTVVIFDSDWNPTADAQAQDRAHRIGQVREVRVLRLITLSPVEERILARAHDKAAMEALVISAGKFEGKGDEGEEDVQGRRRALEDILREELETKAEEMATPGIDGSFLGGTGICYVSVKDTSAAPDDETINEYIARDDNELALFQSMDIARVQTERSSGKPWANVGPGVIKPLDQAVGASAGAGAGALKSPAPTAAQGESTTAEDDDAAAEAALIASDVLAVTRARLMPLRECPVRQTQLGVFP